MTDRSGLTDRSGPTDRPGLAVADAAGGGPLPRAGRSVLGRLGFAMTGLVVVSALGAPWFAPADPFAVAGPSLMPPASGHWMGTDALGRDLFSGILWGGRASLTVATTSALLALGIGLLVGMVSGYRGGWIDDLLMRITELFQTIPRFFFAIVVIALLGPGVDRLIWALGLTSWAGLARVVRSEVLSLREREFVEAARAYGASGTRIVMVEILPNALPSALVMFGLITANVILVEASLGFLGLGDPNVMSWGLLAGQAQGFLRSAWWMWFFPGLAIVTAALALNLLIDGMTPEGRGP